MSKSEGPNVIVFPPVIIVVTVALAVGLQWIVPLGLLARVRPYLSVGCREFPSYQMTFLSKIRMADVGRRAGGIP